jgi:SAM-dependent methyltransferase
MDLSEWGANVGEEARKNFNVWLQNGFYEKYLSGPHVLDIGFDGYIDNVTPVTPTAIGVGINYPGYDGKVLPFADGSQDAVFVSHCLEHIEDYRTVLADWFRVLRVGGHLIVAVPHQYLYERSLVLPSRFNLDHRRFYTPASLLVEVEESIDPLNYRVRMLIDNDRGFDYDVEPEEHAVGCYEILLVIEKIARPAYSEEIAAPPKIHTITRGTFSTLPRPSADNPVMAVSSGAPPKSIIAFKMDHLGDFLLATPALENLRRAFPEAELTFVCGDWNEKAARDLGIFNEIIPFSLFERNAALNEVTSLSDRLKSFKQCVAGRKFDLAIDLRVDSDTRVILQQVNAGLRAGFGQKRIFPFLDVALPYVSPTATNRPIDDFFDASLFQGCFGDHKGPEIVLPGDIYPQGVNIIFGPYKPVVPARYHLRLLMADDHGTAPACDYDIVYGRGSRKLTAGKCEDIATTGIWVDVDDPIDDLEIRVFGRGVEVSPFKFRGCTISKVGQMAGPHQTEMMAMLVALIQQRALFPPSEERVK